MDPRSILAHLTRRHEKPTLGTQAEKPRNPHSQSNTSSNPHLAAPVSKKPLSNVSFNNTNGSYQSSNPSATVASIAASLSPHTAYMQSNGEGSVSGLANSGQASETEDAGFDSEDARLGANGSGGSPSARPFVTGPPAKSHWKPDSKAPVCDHCEQPFSLALRRHHCRRCGNIFCLSCCYQTVRLDQTANYHQAGLSSRVCVGCFDEFQGHLPQLPATGSLGVLAEDNQAVPNDAFLRPNQEASGSATGSARAPFDINRSQTPKDLTQRPSLNPNSFANSPSKPFLSSSSSSALLQEGSNTLASQGSLPPSMLINKDKVPSQNQQGQSLLSVPSDWNWSTF